MYPPTFDGEKDVDVEVRLFNMTKYFQAYDYEINQESLIVIYQIRGKVSLWREEVKSVHLLEEKKTLWDEFHK